MPVHDWTRVDAGLFHDFHQAWTASLRNTLNAGILPADHFALIEQRIPGPIPDVLTLKIQGDDEFDGAENGGVAVAVAVAPPKTRHQRRSHASTYVAKANKITVRHRHGEVVAIIEIVSPGNKAGIVEFQTFVDKWARLIHKKIHLLVIDLHPPGKRDPFGIHKAIWDEFEEEEFLLPPEKPFVLASYDAGPPQVAYVDTVGVGDVLTDMPIFLRPEIYVPVPLERTYQEAWNGFPNVLKHLLETKNG
jgi:hypothetical protein